MKRLNCRALILPSTEINRNKKSSPLCVKCCEGLYVLLSELSVPLTKQSRAFSVNLNSQTDQDELI